MTRGWRPASPISSCRVRSGADSRRGAARPASVVAGGMLRTRLCDLLGVEVPVIAAPMGAPITGPELAAAVSSAGGLGIMSFGGHPPPLLRRQIRRLRELTDRPFGVNVLLSGVRLPVPQDEVVAVCLVERIPVLSF